MEGGHFFCVGVKANGQCRNFLFLWGVLLDKRRKCFIFAIRFMGNNFFFEKTILPRGIGGSSGYFLRDKIFISPTLLWEVAQAAS
jgi:hypothetical protein